MLALFISLVGLMVTLFSQKMLISTRCIHGFMPNLIKKSWTVSNTETDTATYECIKEASFIHHLTKDSGLVFLPHFGMTIVFELKLMFSWILTYPTAHWEEADFSPNSDYSTKGQIISEWLLDVFIWTKKRTKIFLCFCPSL